MSNSVIIAWMSLAVTAEGLGTTLLARTEHFRRPVPTLLVTCSYVLCFYALSRLMALTSPGPAYAVWAGGGVLLVSLSGQIFYGHKPDLPGALGIGAVVLGCAMTGLYS
ncbi:SMR family transporter [Pantoea sp. T14]|jgi:multidrug transporter EmrE-like cation transporter|uniref:DMT family transporter n=1 Tax=Pantoea sp. T14 TaxID=3085685 RepID=UPI002FC8B7FE